MTEEEREAQRTYVAVCDCGGWVTILVVDVPDLKEETARIVAACIRAGYRIEAHTVAQARALPPCPC